MVNTTDHAMQAEITTYLDRANRLNDQRGAVSVSECLSADDLDTLKRAAAIQAFTATILASWGEPQEDVEALASAAGLSLKLAQDMHQPGMNWKGE